MTVYSKHRQVRKVYKKLYFVSNVVTSFHANYLQRLVRRISFNVTMADVLYPRTNAIAKMIVLMDQMKKIALRVKNGFEISDLLIF